MMQRSGHLLALQEGELYCSHVVLASAEAVAGLLCSLGVGWMAAGMQVWMVLEQAVMLMLTAGPHRAAAFLWLLLRGAPWEDSQVLERPHLEMSAEVVCTGIG